DAGLLQRGRRLHPFHARRSRPRHGFRLEFLQDARHSFRASPTMMSLRTFIALASLAFVTDVSATPKAEIRTTSHGVPHVLADDYEGVGFGLGYAFAETDICEIASRWVTVNAQRSRYFGPDEPTTDTY